MVTNTSASLDSSTSLRSVSLRHIALLSLFIVLGSLAALYPLYLLYCAGAAAALGVCWLGVAQVRRAHLELWELLALTGMSGYLVLNYGFENLSLHIGGFPIIISYGLMFASLGLAALAHQSSVGRALKEPAMLCVLGLLVLTAFHLIRDIPVYGIWAARDSSMVVDGIFMLLGLLWSMKRHSLGVFIKWMAVIFTVNVLYGLTLPWGETVWSWSPESGVFLKVPILGHYSGTGDVMLAGALFCLCFTGYVFRRPRWLMMLLVLAQLLGLTITQNRRAYIGSVLALILLVLLGEAKKFGKLLILLPAALAAILLVTSVGGLKITGRIGEINLDFFEEHVRSMSDAQGTPGSSVEGRFRMFDEALQHFRAHPLLGEGFGLPLTSWMDTNNEEGNNAITRTPHNSTVSYLARLGLIGIALWIAFHLSIITRLIYGLRQRAHWDPRLSAFVLWFFLFYVLFMMGSNVEGSFEFPSLAIPFFFFTGFALGLLRWHAPRQNNGERRLAALTSRPTNA